MSRSTKELLVKLLTHSLFLLALHILQSMIFSRLRIGGVSPLLLPLAVVGVALFEGPSWGGGFGLCAGLLCDIAFSETTVLFTFLLTFLGMGIGLLSEYVLARGFPSFLLCAVLSLLLIAFFQIFSPLVFDGVPASRLLPVALGQTLYSGLFLLPVYYVSHRLGRRQKS